MERVCRLCRGPAHEDQCFVRLGDRERPACRSCWQELLLDPARMLRQLESTPLDRTPPAFPALER